ncbi:MAG: hypothetical protein R3D01_09980 [Hyphomicrobiales bacterium]
MDEDEERHQTEEDEDRSTRNREVGHLVGAAIGGAQHEQKIDDGGDEQAKRHLGPPVGHETADQTWAKLLRGERQHHHGDGDDERRHGDHGGDEIGEELGPARRRRCRGTKPGRHRA